MKIMNSRKKVIAALSLSLIALTGCTKVNTVEYNGELYNIEDNSLLNSDAEKLTIKERLSYKDSGLSLILMPGQFNNQLDIKYDTNLQADDDVYEYISNVVNNMAEEDSLNIHISKSNLDFSKIDISRFKSIMFDVANVDFDYTPFYNNTYTFLSANINDKTNIDSIVGFLENIKTENAYINIDFEDNVKVEDSQRVIDALAKIKSVDSVHLHSTNINELNITDLACHTLSLNHPTTDKKLNYDFTINDSVELLFFSSSFAEEYDGESYLESFKVNSKNEKLKANYQIFKYSDNNGFNIKVDNQSVIEVPNNTELDISGLDISEVSNEWLKNFSNLMSFSISPYSDNNYSFRYDRDDMTIEEAIAEKDVNDAKEKIEKKLKEIGVSYTASANGYISLDADFNHSNEEVPEELYTILNREFEDSSKDYLMIDKMNDQFDFSKVNLSNITTASFELTGPDFDFTPFYNQNISNLELVMGEDANHERILEFLKNIRDINMMVSIRFREIDKCQNPELIQQYVDVLSTRKNLKEVTIDAQIADNINYENLVVDKLSLFIDSDKDEINYDININDQVLNFTILTYYNEEYSNDVYIGDISVNSYNKDLITNLIFNSYDYDRYFNVFLDKDTTNIDVPNGSGLRISGVNFDSVDYDAIKELNHLRYLHIGEDGNEDYEFIYYYKVNTFDEAFETFKTQNKNRKGVSLTINNY